MTLEHVTGRQKGAILLYALSTCQWCRKTKELLLGLGVDFSYVYVDLLAGGERDQIMGELAKWNHSRSFPTLVINNNTVIIGFQEDRIREALL